MGEFYSVHYVNGFRNDYAIYYLIIV